jgi:ATP-dependent DNA ligase
VRRAASDGDPGESEGAPQSKKQLHKIAIARCPFANLPMGKHGGWNEGVSLEEMPTMTWVEPHLVVQVAFVEWTDYGLLRHATYLGIRDDKDPRDVGREAT